MKNEKISPKIKIKRPKFIIFTDKDGTLNLDDNQLNDILLMISSMGGMVIPTTGRTVGDIQEDFINKGLRIPKIIIGDNGASIYSTTAKQFLIKKILEHDKVLEIIEEFIKIGGSIDNIRYTDGSRIYASDCESVNEYYANSNTATMCEDIHQHIKDSQDINKITLAGTKEQMQQMAEFCKRIRFLDRYG